MIKIIYTINFLTNGGPTRVLENLIKNLDKNYYEIIVITLINENEMEVVEKIRSQGVRIVELNYKKKLIDILADRNQIIGQINGYHPDVIHTHGIVSTMIVSSKKLKCRKISTIHNSIFEDYKYTYGRYKGILFAYIHIALLKRFYKVICCSKTSYEVIRKYLSQATYIRNGIDIEDRKESNNIRGDIRKQLGIDKNATIYIYAGKLCVRKRVSQLVNMFDGNMADDEYLLIAGDGQIRESLEHSVRDSHIIFLGFKSNIANYFRASDVYVSYSFSEGFSVAIIEALECGLLLLLSDIPSHKECFEMDSNYYIGEIFEETDFVSKKRTIKNRVGDIDNKRASKEFKERYLSSHVMTYQYLKYYEVK